MKSKTSKKTGTSGKETEQKNLVKKPEKILENGPKQQACASIQCAGPLCSRLCDSVKFDATCVI